MQLFSTVLDALRHLRTAALAASVVVLAACGSDSAITEAAAPANAAGVSGTAAVGAPLADATVSLLCNSGGTATTATTSGTGEYNMRLPGGCAAPFFLKVVGLDKSVTPSVTITLYAFADAAGNVNITPLTDIAARFATGNNPDAEFEAVKAASKKPGDLWNSASATEGKAKLLETLAGLGLNTSGINDVLHGAFKAVKGDKTDDLLEALKAKRGGVSVADLADKALKLGGAPSDKPWNALFRVGQNEIKLNLTGCRLSMSSTVLSGLGSNTSSSTTVTTAILTLTRNGDSFNAGIALNSSDTTQTFAGMVLSQIMQQNESGSFDISMAAGTSYLGVEAVQSIVAGENRQNRGFSIGLNNDDFLDVAASGGASPLSQSVKFENKEFTPQRRNLASLDCGSVTNPLTRNNAGSLQAQSRLASIPSVSPTMTLSSSLAKGSDPGGYCYSLLKKEAFKALDVNVEPETMTYTYAVSVDGAISLNGSNVGDFLSGTAAAGAYYYESSDFYPAGRPSSIYAVVAFDRNRGFSVNRTRSDTLGQACGAGL